MSQTLIKIANIIFISFFLMTSFSNTLSLKKITGRVATANLPSLVQIKIKQTNQTQTSNNATQTNHKFVPSRVLEENILEPGFNERVELQNREDKLNKLFANAFDKTVNVIDQIIKEREDFHNHENNFEKRIISAYNKTFNLINNDREEKRNKKEKLERHVLSQKVDDFNRTLYAYHDLRQQEHAQKDHVKDRFDNFTDSEGDKLQNYLEDKLRETVHVDQRRQNLRRHRELAPLAFVLPAHITPPNFFNKNETASEDVKALRRLNRIRREYREHQAREAQNKKQGDQQQNQGHQEHQEGQEEKRQPEFRRRNLRH